MGPDEALLFACLKDGIDGPIELRPMTIKLSGIVHGRRIVLDAEASPPPMARR